MYILLELQQTFDLIFVRILIFGFDLFVFGTCLLVKITLFSAFSVQVDLLWYYE